VPWWSSGVIPNIRRVEQPAEVVNTPGGVGASLTSAGAIVVGRVEDSCLAMEGAADLVQGAAPLVVDPAGSPQRAVAQKEMATAMLSQSGPLDKLAATREMEKSTLADARKIKLQVSTIRASTIQVGTPPNTARPTTPRNMSPVRMEFGLSQEAPMTVVSTPTNNMAADKLVMDKATRRAVERNLDSLVATPQKGPNMPKDTGKSPIDTCTSNLNSIGISLGSTPKSIKISYNALKHIKIDKIKVQPKAGMTGSGEVNPFSLSDG